MSLNPCDFEVPRTAEDLRCFVELVRASVRANRSEFEAGMAKRGLYKQFIDEVEPLCSFAEIFYPKDYKVRPVFGNQGYDAVVFDELGSEFDKVEIAKPYHGAQAAEASRQVVERGYSDAQVCDPSRVLDIFVPFFEATSATKSQKDYSGVTVVFVLASPHALPGFEACFDQQVDQIKNIVAVRNFKAKRVLFYAPPGKISLIQC